MNILYRGDYRPTVYRFKCDKCGTVWECEEQEAQKNFDRNELYLSCYCPVCGKRAIKFVCNCNGGTKAVDK